MSGWKTWIYVSSIEKWRVIVLSPWDCKLKKYHVTKLIMIKFIHLRAIYNDQSHAHHALLIHSITIYFTNQTKAFELWSFKLNIKIIKILKLQNFYTSIIEASKNENYIIINLVNGSTNIFIKNVQIYLRIYFHFFLTNLFLEVLKLTSKIRTLKIWS